MQTKNVSTVYGAHNSFSNLAAALGYSSCFLSALNLVAKQEGIKLPSDVKCDAHVSIGPPSSGSSPFAIAVDLTISSSGSGEQDNQSLQKAVDQAHKVRLASGREWCGRKGFLRPFIGSRRIHLYSSSTVLVGLPILECYGE